MRDDYARDARRGRRRALRARVQPRGRAAAAAVRARDREPLSGRRLADERRRSACASLFSISSVPGHLGDVDDEEELGQQQRLDRGGREVLDPLADPDPDGEVVGLARDRDRERAVGGDDLARGSRPSSPGSRCRASSRASCWTVNPSIRGTSSICSAAASRFGALALEVLDLLADHRFSLLVACAREPSAGASRPSAGGPAQR